MTSWPRSRAVGFAAVIGLLGACAVLVVVTDAPGRPAAAIRGAGPAVRPRRLSQALRPASAATPAGSAGLRLMRQAAAACQQVPFHGVQLTNWLGSANDTGAGNSGAGNSGAGDPGASAPWAGDPRASDPWAGNSGAGDPGASAPRAGDPRAGDPWAGVTRAGVTASVVVDVWHQPGRSVIARFSGSAGPGSAILPAQAEIMTVTPQLLALMRQNYVISYAGAGSADGRAALVIEVRRRDGGLAARYWLDAATKLPLRRELFDASAQIFSEDAFTQLTLGAGPSVPAAGARPWTGRLTAPGRALLRAGGWPLPRSMPGGLTLFASTQTRTPAGRVVGLSYSDGLSVVSVFLQRGQLPARMPGWRPVTDRGDVVYADGQSLAWSAGGYVITVISDAPAGTVAAAVAGLPHAAPPGFWDRMGRGLHRIASWANPLG